jgi:hypothetical protein
LCTALLIRCPSKELAKARKSAVDRHEEEAGYPPAFRADRLAAAVPLAAESSTGAADIEPTPERVEKPLKTGNR